MKKNLWKTTLRIFILVFLLYFLYKLNFPVYFLVIIAIIASTLILLRKTFYKKIEDFLSIKFPFFKKQSPWIKKIIIIIILILFYILIKQTAFALLKIFGLDIQKIIF
ncbi:MAG: hypothetical protein ABH804_02275 [archaeon]